MLIFISHATAMLDSFSQGFSEQESKWVRLGRSLGSSRRASRWRGSGYVRWAHEANRGFLASLAGLGRIALGIGETDEAARCEEFLLLLDPDWDRR